MIFALSALILAYPLPLWALVLKLVKCSFLLQHYKSLTLTLPLPKEYARDKDWIV